MNICILCTDEKLLSVREKGKLVFPKNTNNDSFMKIALSQTGELPVTHWFCFMNGTLDIFNKLNDVREYSIVEESSAKSFLEKNNLRIINVKSITNLTDLFKK